MKILIAPSSFGDTSLLKGYEVIRNPYGRKLTPQETVTLGRDCVGIIAGVEEYRDILNSLSKVCCISRCGAGTDNIDLLWANDLGIVVKNTPDAPTQAVAEMTVGLIFNLLRGISFCDRNIREGKWVKFTGNLLNDKTVGILGYGRIGKAVGKILEGCGAGLIFSDIGDGLTLQELLSQSDILSIHVSSDSCLISHSELYQMKKGAFLVNTSRGKVVDEAALYESLKSGHLAGAALDVFEEEPYTGPLRQLDNVILTSHIGSYTKETRKEMECQSVVNLLKGLQQ